MDVQRILFTIAQSAPGFLMAIVFHEWAHGFVAKKFGDPTAEREGRLTFNPAAHVDPMGTVIFPLIGVVLGWAVIGWAKPVPVDGRNFKNHRKAMFWVSFAGPGANIILGTVSALGYAIVATQVGQTFSYYAVTLQMLQYSIFINFLLAFFNLIPLPPLDGSKMVASFLKGEALRRYEEVARFTPMIFLGIIALSMMGVSTLGTVLGPLTSIGQSVTVYFLRIFS
ncbi:MAG: site-2 protease family protein [Bacteriovoracaceae bacterium]